MALHGIGTSRRHAKLELVEAHMDGVWLCMVYLYDPLEHRVSFVNMNQLLVTQSIVCPQETDHVFDKLAVWGPHEPVWAHLGPHGPMQGKPQGRCAWWTALFVRGWGASQSQPRWRILRSAELLTLCPAVYA